MQPAPILAQAWGALITQGGSQPPPSLFWSSSQSHHLCVNSIVFLGESGPKMFFLGHNGIFKFFWLFLEVFFLTFVLFRPPNLPHVNWGPNEISPLVAYLSKFPAQQPPTLQDVHMAFQSVFFVRNSCVYKPQHQIWSFSGLSFMGYSFQGRGVGFYIGRQLRTPGEV